MLYLNENSIKEIGIDWTKMIQIIGGVVENLNRKECVQPIKPYLRFKNPKNRIIAMPAYVGGDCDRAGIKWIASFPDNINTDIPRANSIIILNNSDTGVVESVLNTPLMSTIRTSSVTGFLIDQVLKVRDRKNLNVGIIGFGPIGKYHLKMCKELLGERVNQYYIYDLRTIEEDDPQVKVLDTWQELYENCDIVMCCTVTPEPYIDCQPKKGALILNVSLRDFKDESYPYLNKHIIVDDWDEVCRENTTIDVWNRNFGLMKEGTRSLQDVLCGNYLASIPDEEAIFFCPMGMGVFDIAIAEHYYREASKRGVGVLLD